MSDYFEQERNFRNIQAISAQRRLEAMQAKLSLALTFCTLAETELDFNEVAQARKLIEIVQQTAEATHQHLAKPNHIPPEHIEELRQQLVQVEERMQSVQSRLIVAASAQHRHPSPDQS